MLRIAAIFTVVFLLAACTSVNETPAEPSGETPSAKTAAGDDILIGDPVAHRNLTIFPLYLKSPEEIKEDYISLESALKDKKVEVREVGAAPGQEARQVAQPPQPPQPANQEAPQQQAQEPGRQQEVASEGTVNAVEIENKSDRPIYILAGQVIIGGKQDRVITKDTIVPKGEKIQVEVCCVEQGRWSPRSSVQTAEKAMYFGCTLSSNTQGSIRKLSQIKGAHAQGEVWEEVKKTADKLNAQTDTGTYKQVVEKTQKSLDESLDIFKKAFAQDKKICGFVACINGEVDSCDLFTSPKLLAMFREACLRGYALDALNAGEAKEAKKVTAADAKRFLAEMKEAQKSTEKLAEGRHRRVDKMESEKVIGFENAAKCSEGYYKSLHYNAYSKKKK